MWWKLAAEFPENQAYVGLSGVIAARRGDRERAMEISEQIAVMDTDLFLDEDGRTVWRSRILATLGEHAEAVSLLQETARSGWVNPFDLANIIEFAPLRDHPDFQELIRPKG